MTGIQSQNVVKVYQTMRQKEKIAHILANVLYLLLCGHH